MKRNILQIIGIYLSLTIISTVIMHDFSLRYTLFLLIDAIIVVISARVFAEEKKYYAAIGCGLLLGSSIFVIRYLTVSMPKVAEADILFSYIFAICNLVIMLVSIVPNKILKIVMFAGGGTCVLLPLILFWGYYVSEASWLDAEALMAVLQTNFGEAVSYIRDRTGWYAVFLLLLYAAILISWGNLVCNLRTKGRTKGTYFIIVISIILSYVLFMRTSENILTKVYMEVQIYQANYEDFAKQCEARKKRIVQGIGLDNKGEDGIYVLVIGESQNRTRMSAYGYEKETTPWLDNMKKDDNMLLFNKAYSCHVQTVPVITYALTSKNQYNDINLEDAVSLLEVANEAGYETVWISNQMRYGQWTTPITAIAASANQQIWINDHNDYFIDTDYYDEEIVKKMDNISMKKKMLIVVHLMGNHGTYRDRYPSNFKKFGSVGESSEYDNSILYNDYVMNKMVDRVKKWENFKGLMYLSDHSEGVNYEQEHNPSTFIFDMTYIPMYMYISYDWQKDHPEKIRQLRKACNYVFTNDLVFNTMLGVMGVRISGFYEEENDLTSSRYDSNIKRFMTLYGRRLISDDDGTGK